MDEGISLKKFGVKMTTLLGCVTFQSILRWKSKSLEGEVIEGNFDSKRANQTNGALLLSSPKSNGAGGHPWMKRWRILTHSEPRVRSRGEILWILGGFYRDRLKGFSRVRGESPRKSILVDLCVDDVFINNRDQLAMGKVPTLKGKVLGKVNQI